MTQAVKTWQILELIKVTEALFSDNGIENPRLNAELLLADSLGMRRFDLYLCFDRPIGENELACYRNHVKRRLLREPLQYITGKSEFFGLSFEVNPSVLIPRPETELLVEKTLELIKEKNIISPRILEIGTGSGCISIAIATAADCSIDAIDISSEALQTAEKNSKTNNTTGRIRFIQQDILNEPENFNAYDIVVSNPPYIPIAEFDTLEPEVKQFEPRSALTDNGDGLIFNRRILDIWRNSPACKALLVEIGDKKMNSVEEVLKKKKIESYTFHNDMLNTPRVLAIERAA